MKGNSDEEGQQSRKKKDLSKLKCFFFHKNGHYASQCLDKKKDKEKRPQEEAATGTQLSEFVAKFENDFSLVSRLSTNTVHMSS